MLAVQLVTASYAHSFVFPPSCHRCLSGMVWSLRFPSGRCLIYSACCGMDAGAATAAMREDDRDEDFGSF
jgi:hypothetical protein